MNDAGGADDDNKGKKGKNGKKVLKAKGGVKKKPAKPRAKPAAKPKVEP